MSTITHKNLQELCRACLRTLNKSTQSTSESETGDGDLSNGAASNFSHLLLPNLCKLFKLFTTYDVRNEYEDFPKRLCEWCYGKLLEYDEFRKAAFKNTEMLYELWSTRQQEEEKQNATENDADDGIKAVIKLEQQPTSLHKQFKFEEYENDDDDDKLLLPELANMPLNIKPEPFFEAMEPQFTLPSFMEEGEINQDLSSNESYDTADNADDEELILSNDDINSSSQYSSNGRATKRVLPRERNPDKKSLYCNICNKQFYKQVYLDAHVRSVHMGQTKPFQCAYCPKAFTRYKQLHVHTKTQHLDRRNSKNDEDTLHSDLKLKLRRQNSSDEFISPTGDFQDETDELGMDHTCQLCWRKYSSKRALREHIKRHNQIKEHVCSECGVAKVTRTELVTHMRVHLPNLEKFPCPQCPQVFNHKNAISRHVKVVHEGLKRFSCDYCTKKFGTRNSKVCHERLHTGERPFTCEICLKAFVQQEGLRSHMKNHDKNLRTHVCRYCSQRFITLKNLIDHEKRHASDKPHICNICSKGYYSEEDLRTHRTSHFETESFGDQNTAVKPEIDNSFPSSMSGDYNTNEDSMYSTF